MKKALIGFIFLITILIFIKFWYSKYTINYEINNYKILTKYENKRFYYEIKKDNLIYNFDYYDSRTISKTKISEIKEIKGEKFNCIYPVIKNIETYPLCYENGKYTDFNLIESELLDIYKEIQKESENKDKDFIYFNTLNENQYVALWNYNGYIIMNNNNYEIIDIFEKEKYDNTLAYIINDNIYMANYDQEHEFNTLIKLNLLTKKKEKIQLNYNIDFDSYFVGNIKDKLYLFDNKYAVLYEIDTKKNEVKVIGNNEKGYIKYDGEKFVNCSKSEYKVNKITYNTNKSLYEYTLNEGLYKSIKENKKTNLKINDNNIDIIKEYKNQLYFMDKDNFYIYTPNKGNKKIFYNFELEFNDKNTIFVYIK